MAQDVLFSSESYNIWFSQPQHILSSAQALPVHHDDEYRIKLEKEELLRRLGIGTDSEEHRQASMSSTLERLDSDRTSARVSKREAWLEGEAGTNIIAHLRVLVMQNELILYGLRSLEEARTARTRPFNPAEWK